MPKIFKFILLICLTCLICLVILFYFKNKDQSIIKLESPSLPSIQSPSSQTPSLPQSPPSPAEQAAGKEAEEKLKAEKAADKAVKEKAALDKAALDKAALDKAALEAGYYGNKSKDEAYCELKDPFSFRSSLFCAAINDPVECPNGQFYSNDCVASGAGCYNCKKVIKKVPKIKAAK